MSKKKMNFSAEQHKVEFKRISVIKLRLTEWLLWEKLSNWYLTFSIHLSLIYSEVEEISGLFFTRFIY